jgi:hypothetical protein
VLGEYLGKTTDLNLVGQNFLEKVMPKLRPRESGSVNHLKMVGEERRGRQRGQHA